MSKWAIDLRVCEGCESKKCKIAVGCARLRARSGDFDDVFQDDVWDINIS